MRIAWLFAGLAKLAYLERSPFSQFSWSLRWLINNWWVWRPLPSTRVHIIHYPIFYSTNNIYIYIYAIYFYIYTYRCWLCNSLLLRYIFCSHFGSSTESPVLEPKWQPRCSLDSSAAWCCALGVPWPRPCNPVREYKYCYYNILLISPISNITNITIYYFPVTFCCIAWLLVYVLHFQSCVALQHSAGSVNSMTGYGSYIFTFLYDYLYLSFLASVKCMVHNCCSKHRTLNWHLAFLFCISAKLEMLCCHPISYI